MKTLAAYTCPDTIFPPFFNVSRDDDGSVVVSIRGNPTVKEGVRVCGHDCAPGGPGCNNYCNRHPDKSLPMADRPEPCTHFKCAETVSYRMRADEWEAIKAMIAAGTL